VCLLLRRHRGVIITQGLDDRGLQRVAAMLRNMPHDSEGKVKMNNPP